MPPRSSRRVFDLLAASIIALSILATPALAAAQSSDSVADAMRKWLDGEPIRKKTPPLDITAARTHDVHLAGVTQLVEY